jgi:hypothetical protein
MRTAREDALTWGMCDAPHPSEEGIRCNRGLRHSGEHRDSGPRPCRHEPDAIWYRWPREKATKGDER